MRKLLPALVSSLLFAGTYNTSVAGDIASIDTGVLPGTLAGFLIDGGTDLINNDSDPIDDEPGQHGNEAALSARSAFGGTRILPIKAYGADFSTTSGIVAQALEFAAQSNVNAVSHSIASIQNTPVPSLQAVTNSGKILVMQAGNAAAPGPTGDAANVSQLGGRGIAVGGLRGGDIWVASNRAGNLQDFFLVADVVSPNGLQVGTSMATPRVAAVAAEVAARFPFLSPEEVVQVLFQSARDLGRPGVDSTFGHGEVDLNAAVAAVGEGNIPAAGGGDSGGDDGGGGGGSGTGIALAALAVGGAVAYAIFNKKEDLQKTIFVDNFGRAFDIDLSTRARTRGNTNLFNLVNARQNPTTLVPLNKTENSQTFAFVNDPTNQDSIQFDAFNTDRGLDPLTVTQQVSIRHYTDNGKTDYSMGLNSDLSNEFGALSLSEKKYAPATQFQHTDIFTTPVLGYSAQGTSFRYGWNEDKTSHRLGVAVIDDQEEHGIVSNSLLYENRVEKEKLKMGFQVGALLEDGNLLGGASDGAFSADSTDTYYIGINGAYDMSKNVSLIGGYFQGFSDVEANQNALLDQFDDIRTEGYGIGLLVNNALSSRGSFGISYSSPLQTTSGSARLTLPTSQNPITGTIGFESSQLSFEGADRENVVEAYYNFAVTKKSDVFAHISYTNNPSSDIDLDRDRTFYLGWKRSF